MQDPRDHAAAVVPVVDDVALDNERPYAGPELRSQASDGRLYGGTEHMTVARDLLLPHGLRRLESDQCMVGPEPTEGTVIAATHAHFDTPEAARAALAAVASPLLASVPTYSSAPPEIMVSVVTIHA